MKLLIRSFVAGGCVIATWVAVAGGQVATALPELRVIAALAPVASDTPQAQAALRRQAQTGDVQTRAGWDGLFTARW